MKTSGKLGSGRLVITRRQFFKILAVGAIAAVPFDAALIEPRRIQVTRHKVFLSKLPSDLDGLAIAQISDLHRSSVVPDDLIRSAVRMTNSLSPDITVVTGDFISKPAANAAPCAEMLSMLKARLGVYGVLGNHDIWTDADAVRRSLEEVGVTVLKNENTEILRDLVLLGLDDYWAGNPDFRRTWKGVDANKAHILLSHSPLAINGIRHKDCLMLSGHTHGGQVHIPFIPRNTLPGLLGWKYIQGWYREGKTAMYVNRGIGMINPPIRFLCRPEISLFTLKSRRV